jgi:hypothetical protein
MKTTFLTKAAILLISGSALSGLAYSQNRAAHLIGSPGVPRTITVPKGFIEFPAENATTTLPSWTGTSQGVSFTMLGGNPATGGTTVLPVVFVPIVFKIGGLTFDPTKPVKGSTLNEIQLLGQSPIFTPVDLKAGSVDLGVNQFEDNFMRANFWSQSGAGSNNYHTILRKPVVTGAITLNVPSNQGITEAAGSSTIGDVNLTYFQNALNSILANTKLGLNGGEFVIFVYYNVFFYEGTSSNCCVLGFHGQSSSNIIYGAAAFNDPGEFSGAILQDVTVITHEIGEAINDPYISTNVNIVPAFGNVGQVSGCQDNLEVGDPVTGLATTITMPNGFTYHPEDLVFHGWFTRETASTSVNGWYTLLNNFTGDAKKCPPGGSN